jgi:hypothetical protein
MQAGVQDASCLKLPVTAGATAKHNISFCDASPCYAIAAAKDLRWFKGIAVRKHPLPTGQKA